MTVPAIEVAGLCRDFGKRDHTVRALSDVSFQIDQGAIVGLLGSNGAGKTTLTKILATLLLPTSGSARIFNHDVTRDLAEVRRYTGVVFGGERGLYGKLTGRENLRFFASVFGTTIERERAQIAPIYSQLEPFAARRASALSGGMKQKLAIASALLPRPALLLLDEPTAGVDVMSRAEIWALLEREREAALVLIATSYLDEAAAADRLLYLERGRLIAAGTPAELRAAGPLQVYRAWGDAPAIARAARALPYVEGARATGRFARIEVRRAEAPGTARLLADLAALAGGAVSFTEETPLDMESTLRALSGGV